MLITSDQPPTGAGIPLGVHGHEDVVDASPLPVLVMSPTAGGSTSCLQVPILLRWKGNAIVVDLIGELHDLTASFRELEFGHRILRMACDSIGQHSEDFERILEDVLDSSEPTTLYLTLLPFDTRHVAEPALRSLLAAVLRTPRDLTSAPVLLMIDKVAPAATPSEALIETLPWLAQRGIKLVTTVGDWSDLVATFGQDSLKVWRLFGMHVMTAPRDYETALIAVDEMNASYGWKSQRCWRPDDLILLPKRYAVLLRAARRPVRLRLRPHYQLDDSLQDARPGDDAPFEQAILGRLEHLDGE